MHMCMNMIVFMYTHNMCTKLYFVCYVMAMYSDVRISFSVELRYIHYGFFPSSSHTSDFKNWHSSSYPARRLAL